MGLESSFNYPSDLNADNPAAGDNPNEGDNHLRGIKNVLKTTFPSLTGAVTCTQTELNVLDGIPATLTATELGYVDGVTSAIQTQIDTKVTKAKTISAKSADFTAAVGYHYFMTDNGKTCTFPSGSAYGDEFSVTHNDGVSTVTQFALGSEKFCGGTTVPGTISARVTKTFRYTNATYGWVEV